MCFVWKYDLSIADWSNQREIWLGLSIASVDYISAESGYFYYFVYVVLSILSMCAIMIIYFFAMVCFKKKISDMIIKFFRVLLYLDSEMYFIPITNTLLLVVKYSNNSYFTIEEYSNNPLARDISLGLKGLVIGILALSVHIVLALIFEAFRFEIRHSLTNKDLAAKSNPSVDILSKISYFIICCLYVFIQKQHYVLFIIIFILVNFGIASKYLYELPYYSFFKNYSKIFLHSNLSAIGFFFLLSIFQDNATIVLILAFFMQPGFLIAAKIILNYRINKLKGIEIEALTDFFELNIRQLLLMEDSAEQINKFTNLNYKKTLNKLVIVYQTYYCIDILENESVALLKANQINYSGLNLTENFQIYKCQKTLESICLNTSEGLKLCFFLYKYSKTMKYDQQFCENFIKLINQAVKNDTSELEKTLKIFSKHYKNIVHGYEKLSQEFHSNLAKEAASTFIDTFCLDESTEFTKKKHVYHQIKTNKPDAEINFAAMSTNDALIMVVSACEKDLGKIIYMSDTLCEFFGTCQEEIPELSLFDFIPRTFSSLHTLALKKFIENSFSKFSVKHNTLMMCNKQGFLLPCKVTAESVGFRSKIYFVIIFQSLGQNPKIAIIESNSKIIAHSELFPGCLGCSDLYIEDQYLNSIIGCEAFNELSTTFKVSLPIRLLNADGYTRVNLVLELLEVFTRKLLMVKLISGKRKTVREIKNYDLLNIEDNLDDVCISTGYSTKKPKFPDIKIKSARENSLSRTSPVSIYFFSLNKINAIYRLQKIFSIIFIISVLLILFLNIFLWLFFNDKVSEFLTLTSLNHLGDLYQELSLLGLFTQTIDINHHMNMPATFNFSDYLGIISNIKTLKLDIREDSLGWDDCKTADFIQVPIIPYWRTPSNPEMTYINLLDFLDKSQEHAELFYNATVNGLQDSDEDTFFLIYTSFRFTVLEYKNSLDGMKDCEINRTSDMEELCIMFITSIGVAMAFFYIILGFFIILINKKIKELWTYVFEKVQFSEKATKQMAKFRLQEVHKVKEFEEEDQNELKNEVFNGHWKRNMGVLTIMFMFAVGFYMTFYYEFIRDIVDLIAFRIIFADILNSRRAGVLHTAYFTQDIAMGNRTNGSYDHFHNFTLFPSSETMFNRINSDMASLRKFYFTDNFKQKTPNAVIDVIFKSFNSPKPNLQHGIYNSISIFKENSFYLTGSKNQLIYSELTSFLQDSYDICNSYEEINPITDSELVKKIKEILSDLIIFCIVWSSFQIVVACIIFWKYYIKDKQLVENISIVMKFIPMNSKRRISCTSSSCK